MNTYIGQPALIGASGVINVLEPKLSKEEQTNFTNSAEIIKQAFHLIK